MTLNPLRYFDEVARLGSIRVAAERLHVAPSAVSRHIRNLEDEIGIALFERHARGVTLTLAGKIYAGHTRAVLLDRERARSEIDDLKGLRRGHIRIYSVDGVVAGPLSDALSAFHHKFPGITFRLVSTGTETVTRAVCDGEADVGIAFQSRPNPNLNVAHRIKDPLYAVVIPSHPIAALKSTTLKETLKYPIAIPELTFGIRKLIDTRLRTLNLIPKPVLETNSIEALRGFARSGAGVTMLNYLSAKRDVDLGLVKAVPLEDQALRQASIDICVLENRALPVAVQEFVLHLHRSFSADLAEPTDRRRPAKPRVK